MLEGSVVKLSKALTFELDDMKSEFEKSQKYWMDKVEDEKGRESL